MSRSGRAADLLNDWKDHEPKACDGRYCEQSHFAEAQEVIEALHDCDPWFDQDMIQRLRGALKAGWTLQAFDDASMPAHPLHAEWKALKP